MLNKKIAYKMSISLVLSLITAIATWAGTVLEEFNLGIFAPLIAVILTQIVNFIRELRKEAGLPNLENKN